MRRRYRVAAAEAATLLAAAGLAVFAGVLVLLALPMRAGVISPYPSPLVIAMLTAFLLLTPILGWLVATRQPRNPAGWLFLVMTLLLGLGFLADSFGRHLAPSPQLGLFVSVGSALGSFWTAALTLQTSLFPTGRLPSPRWRLVVALPIAATALEVISGIFDPGGGISPPIAGLTYPLGRPDWKPVLDAMYSANQVLTSVGLVGFLGLLAVRFRRSRGIARQQLKLFVSAMTVIASILLFGLVVNQFDGDWGNAAWIAFQGSLILLPLSVTAAILRYRLFEIDRLINRTIVYVALTAVLGAIYALSVVALSGLLAPLANENALAVAGSTLLVAALFQPARRRVQHFVDARFYRGRYEANRELEAFRARARGEVDPQRLADEVGRTLMRTMQPAFVTLWIRSRESGAVTVPERARRRMDA